MKHGVSWDLLGGYKMNKRFLQFFILAIFSIGLAKAVPAKHPKRKAKSHALAHSSKKQKKVVAPRNYMYGFASYYGGRDGFEGRQMANGDIFHSKDVNVCAHPSLPLGTKLKVTNQSNGRSIYVEVTDRMPRRSRVIDLSKGGAKALGMQSSGIARVQLLKITDDEFEQKKSYIEVDDDDDGSPH